MKEMVRLALQAPRSAVHRHPAIIADRISHCLGTGDGQVIAVEVHIAGDIQIQKTVAVVVAPGRSRRPVAQRDSGLFGDIGKCPVVIVVVKPVLAVVTHEDIRPAVVVVVGNAHPVAPAVVGHAGLRGYIGKRSVMVVMKQRGMRGFFLAVERIEC